MNKKWILILPPVTIMLIFTLLVIATRTRKIILSSDNTLPNILYFGIYALIGCFIVLDMFFCHMPQKKIEIILVIERIVIIVLIISLFDRVISSYALVGRSIWGIVVGYEAMSGVISLYILLNPYLKKNAS